MAQLSTPSGTADVDMPAPEQDASMLATPLRTPARRPGRQTPETWSTQRRRKRSDGYRFNLLPDESFPESIKTPYKTPTRSARKPANNNRSPMIEESPARYTPDKVKAAIMSFADFLHFLEENQSEHPLMPTIIQRFSELGTVIESQKRHIDRWKEKELDLAISEAQQNLDVMRDLGNTIRQQELQLASWQVEKQKWEEQYQLAAQEIQTLKHQGNLQVQQLNTEITELRQVKVNLEEELQQKNTLLESMQKGSETLQQKMEQLDHENAKHAQEQALWGQQRNAMGSLEQQIKELRQLAEAQHKQSAELEQAAATWKEKFEEQEKYSSELENALHETRQDQQERDNQFQQLEDEANKLHTELEASRTHYEQQLSKQQEYIRSLEADREQLADQLQQDGERQQQLTNEIEVMRIHTEKESTVAMKHLENNFLQEKARLEDEMHHEVQRLTQVISDLDAQVERLKDANEQKSAEIDRLMTSQHELQQRQRSQQSEEICQMEEELNDLKTKCEQLAKELTEKDQVHAEDMKVQSEEFEAQYMEFVGQVEGQLNELTQDNEHLRATLEAKEKTFVQQSEEVIAARDEEAAKFAAEFEQLQGKAHELDRENGSLRRELDYRVHELEVLKKENRDLNEQIQNYLSPHNDPVKQAEELLHRERLRLEEQKHEMHQQMEAMRKEMDEKLDEASQVHFQSVQQESAHRMATRSLQIEKEELNRKLIALSTEKTALEFQLKSVYTEKDECLQIITRLEKDKRVLELKMQELIQVNENFEAQHQTVALANEDARMQVESLNTQLLQRDEQINHGRQQLQSCQETIRGLEERSNKLQSEVENLQGWNTQLKMQLEAHQNEKRLIESVRREETVKNLRASQRVMEEDLSTKYQQMKAEMMHRIREEQEKAQRVQSLLETKLNTQENQFNDELRSLAETKLALEQQVHEFTSICDRLQSELEYVKGDRDSYQETVQEMEREIALLEEERAAQASAADQTQETQNAYQELQTMHEQFKKDVTVQLNEKSERIADLEENNGELLAKLEREKEMTRHLMDQAHAEKQKQADTKLNKSQFLNDQTDRIREFEHKIQQLERTIQMDKELQTATEQRVMHEKLTREREFRSLQTRCEGVEVENAALREEVAKKTHAINELERITKTNSLEISRAREEVENAEKEMNQKLEEMEDELNYYQSELNSKNEEVTRLKEAAHQESCQLKAELAKKSNDMDMLKRQNEEQLNHLHLIEHREATHSAKQESSLRSRMNTLQKRYDQILVRETDLTNQVKRLRDEITEMQDLFCREMQKLSIDVGSTGKDKSVASDKIFRNGLLEVSKLLRSYQDRETRQDSLIHRKEQQINDLKSQLEQLRRSLHAREEELSAKQRSGQAKSDFQAQVDAMSEEVSNLVLENRHLNDANDRTKREWADKCAALKRQLQELKDENAKQKQSKLSSAEIKKIVDKNDYLTAQLMQKEDELRILRSQEPSQRKSHSSNKSNKSNDSHSRRLRDLMSLIQQKEEKIMVLNDHMTELMTQSIRLQHENELYVTRFGALEGSNTTINGTINNSDTRRTGNSTQYVR